MAAAKKRVNRPRATHSTPTVQDDGKDGEQFSRPDAALHQRRRGGRRYAGHRLGNAMREDHQPDGDAYQWPGQRLDEIVERLELGDQNLWFGLETALESNCCKDRKSNGASESIC